ncbi:MAG: hypothetical protein JRJ29_00420 [Deltaproteobacteria bacterium]|nr:hypothetical protein [Deltaproteobacteria bacterium]MBW2081631.1 hypothetical protein [Deltaproteobacteria bacterium]
MKVINFTEVMLARDKMLQGKISIGEAITYIDRAIRQGIGSALDKIEIDMLTAAVRSGLAAMPGSGEVSNQGIFSAISLVCGEVSNEEPSNTKEN